MLPIFINLYLMNKNDIIIENQNDLT